MPARKTTLAEEQAAAAEVETGRRAPKRRRLSSILSSRKISASQLARLDSGSDPLLSEARILATSRKPVKVSVNAKAKVSKRKTRTSPRGSNDSANPAQDLFDAGGGTPFLDLPPELRNEVYRQVLVVDYEEESLLDNGHIVIGVHRPCVPEPALLAVNRQIRSETLSIFYGENVFRIAGSTMIMRFLRTADEEVIRALRYVQIATEPRRKPRDSAARIRQLLREFKSRGLRRSAIHFEAEAGEEIEWMNLRELEQLG